MNEPHELSRKIRKKLRFGLRVVKEGILKIERGFWRPVHANIGKHQQENVMLVGKVSVTPVAQNYSPYVLNRQGNKIVLTLFIGFN